MEIALVKWKLRPSVQGLGLGIMEIQIDGK